MADQKWDSYSTLLPLKAQGTLRQRQQKKFKRQRLGRTEVKPCLLDSLEPAALTNPAVLLACGTSSQSQR